MPVHTSMIPGSSTTRLAFGDLAFAVGPSLGARAVFALREPLARLLAVCLLAGTAQADPRLGADAAVAADQRHERRTVLATDEWAFDLGTEPAARRPTAARGMGGPPPVPQRHLFTAERVWPVGASDDEDVEVEIPDDGLRCAVAEALGQQPEDDITRGQMAGLPALDVPASSCEGPVTDLAGLEHAVNLRTLNLADNAVADLGPLAELNLLHYMDLGGNPVSDLAPLAGLAGLVWLRLERTGLTDLDPLAGLTRLEILSLGHNLVSDLAPLAGLVHVTWLSLPGNAVTDLAPLAGLAALDNLNLGDNLIEDIGPVAGLADLTSLWLPGNAVSDLGPLAELAALETLNLDDNLIEDVGPLGGLVGLTWLSLLDNAVADLAPLAGLVALETLDLGDNLVEDIGPLASLVRLAWLALSGNAVADLGPLAAIAALETLDLGDNLIEDIGPLAGLVRLTWLSFSGNAVADLGPLSNLTTLQSLELRDNLVSDLAPLAGLTDLRVLGLTGNQIADIGPLALLTDLSGLGLGRNRIRDLAPLSGMSGLNVLIVSHNDVSDLGPLSSLTNLQTLDVGYNGVADLSALSGLTGLGALGLWKTGVSDLGPLSGLAGLWWLIAGDNDLSDIGALAGLTGLVRLNLVQCDLADVGPLSGLTRLDELMLQANRVSDIVPLADLPDLESLALDANPLDADSVAQLQDMREAGTSVAWDWESLTTDRVWFLPSARDPWRQGFVRLINGSDQGGDVDVVAVDDTGRRYGPLTLFVGANRTVHFNSDDLESGNVRKGLLGGTGPGEGDWRLEFESDLALQALAYVRTPSGFVASVHDVVPVKANRYHVGVFNPASDRIQASALRLTNPGAADAEVTITGIDDRGRSPGTPVRTTVPAGASVTLDAVDLESGFGVAGALSDGAGRWRLVLEPTQPIVAASLLYSRASGHVANLSTRASSGGGSYTVPLFPSASDPRGREGFVRVVNRSGKPGRVRVDARDDAGNRRSVVLAVGAGEAAHFNSRDLELGNARRGLSGRAGGGTGDWSLALASQLDIDVMAFVHTPDGFLTTMHDGPVASADGYLVPFFNPGSNTRRPSTLRLVNGAAQDLAVTIVGIDDRGASPGSGVDLTVPGRGTLMVSAADLESGAAGPGALGNGRGKWRLWVLIQPDQALTVTSLLSSPTGHLTNLSTWP